MSRSVSLNLTIWILQVCTIMSCFMFWMFRLSDSWRCVIIHQLVLEHTTCCIMLTPLRHHARWPLAEQEGRNQRRRHWACIAWHEIVWHGMTYTVQFSAVQHSMPSIAWLMTVSCVRLYCGVVILFEHLLVHMCSSAWLQLLCIYRLDVIHGGCTQTGLCICVYAYHTGLNTWP